MHDDCNIWISLRGHGCQHDVGGCDVGGVTWGRGKAINQGSHFKKKKVDLTQKNKATYHNQLFKLTQLATTT